MSAQPVAVVSQLAVRRGSFQLGPLDLAVRPGEILVLLGENGAGKTTLINSMLGLLPTDRGSVQIAGHEVKGRSTAVLTAVGYVPDADDGLIDELTAPELWDLRARIVKGHGGGLEAMRERAAQLADRLHFAPEAGKRIKDFSHGMRKKTQIIGAQQHDPPVAVLDEPRSGLDPMGIRILEELIRQGAEHNKAIICSTHDVHWAHRIGTHVAILHAGELKAFGEMADVAVDANSLEDLFFDISSSSSLASHRHPERS